MPLFNALRNVRCGSVCGNDEVCAGDVAGISLVVELRKLFGGIG